MLVRQPSCLRSLSSVLLRASHLLILEVFASIAPVIDAFPHSVRKSSTSQSATFFIKANASATTKSKKSGSRFLKTSSFVFCLIVIRARFFNPFTFHGDLATLLYRDPCCFVSGYLVAQNCSISDEATLTHGGKEKLFTSVHAKEANFLCCTPLFYQEGETSYF